MKGVLDVEWESQPSFALINTTDRVTIILEHRSKANRRLHGMPSDCKQSDHREIQCKPVKPRYFDAEGICMK